MNKDTHGAKGFSLLVSCYLARWQWPPTFETHQLGFSHRRRVKHTHEPDSSLLCTDCVRTLQYCKEGVGGHSWRRGCLYSCPFCGKVNSRAVTLRDCDFWWERKETFRVRGGAEVTTTQWRHCQIGGFGRAEGASRRSKLVGNYKVTWHHTDTESRHTPTSIIVACSPAPPTSSHGCMDT